MTAIAAEEGFSECSVSRVVARSGVSRRTFYEIFEDRQHCFLEAFHDAVLKAGEYVIPRYRESAEHGESWRTRVRTGLVAFLSFLDHEPEIARLLIVESLASGEPGLEHRASVLDTLTGVIDEGGLQPKARSRLPSLTGEGTVGAVLSLIHSRMLSSNHAPLVTLVNPLMSVIVFPYFGATAAEQELTEPAPTPLPRARTAATMRLQATGMRLTHRTILALLAVGSNPGGSNREIAASAGITDQGQTSKLLSRLERLGLTVNSGEGQARGAPNAWTLTSWGQEINSVIQEQTRG